jgi:carboxylesterase
MAYSEYFQNPHLDPSPYIHRGGPIGVLLIHGYSATPVEMSLVAKHLSERGCTVSAPLLPRHGTSIEDFHSCEVEDWTDHVESAYNDLKADCDSVFVGGISLGGLLALHLGTKYQEIAGLILYAPALKLQNRLASLAPYLKYFTRTFSWRKARIKKSIVDERWQGYGIDSLPAVSQLLEIQHQVQQSIPEITQPILIFQGRRDQTVDPEGAQYLYNRVNSMDKQLIWLDKSGHIITLDVEWEIAAEKTTEFIQRLSS